MTGVEAFVWLVVAVALVLLVLGFLYRGHDRAYDRESDKYHFWGPDGPASINAEDVRLQAESRADKESAVAMEWLGGRAEASEWRLLSGYAVAGFTVQYRWIDGPVEYAVGHDGGVVWYRRSDGKEGWMDLLPINSIAIELMKARNEIRSVRAPA